MKTEVKGLGDIGIITDRDAHDIPNNAWSSLNNIRCKRGYIEPMDGYEDMTDTGDIPNTNGLAVYLHQLTSINNSTSNYFVCPYDYDGDGFAEKIYAVSSAGTVYNITRQVSAADGDYVDSPQWSVCQFNGVVILNNGIDNPQYWGGNVATDCLPVPYDSISGTKVWNTETGETGFDTDNTGGANDYAAKIIRPFKNQLIAMNITEDGNNYPYMLHWSHPADPGSLPITWDYNNSVYDAGRVSLAETTGYIVDAIPLGDMLVVYKEDSIYRLSYVGGTFVYDRDTITTSHGLYSTNCACDIGGMHVCVGDGVVYVHSGGEIKNILEGHAADNLFDSIDQDYYYNTFVVHNRPENEVWICYPEQGYQWANKALIWNYSNNAWYPRDIPQSSTIKIGIGLTGNSVDVWDDAGNSGDLDGAGYTSWDVWNIAQWVSRNYSAIGDTLIAATNQLTKFGVGKTSDSVSAIKTDIRLADVDQWLMFREVIPHANGESFSVEIGTQHVIDDGVDWETPQTFTPGTTRKLNFRCSAPNYAIKFSGNNNWRISGYTLDLVKRGAR